MCNNQLRESFGIFNVSLLSLYFTFTYGSEKTTCECIHHGCLNPVLDGQGPAQFVIQQDLNVLTKPGH